MLEVNPQLLFPLIVVLQTISDPCVTTKYVLPYIAETQTTHSPLELGFKRKDMLSLSVDILKSWPI